jgi:hypothetical protein
MGRGEQVKGWVFLTLTHAFLLMPILQKNLDLECNYYVLAQLCTSNFITSIASAATPNFISDIFYLCNALGHYGYIRTIQVYEDLGKTLDDYQRHHDMIAGEGSWMGVRIFFDDQSLSL